MAARSGPERPTRGGSEVPYQSAAMVRTGKAVEISTPIVSQTPPAMPAQSDRLHEDLALFRTVEQELRGLIERTETALARGSAHGRRLARLRTVLEDAMLQARQGAHEAHYNQ